MFRWCGRGRAGEGIASSSSIGEMSWFGLRSKRVFWHSRQFPSIESPAANNSQYVLVTGRQQLGGAGGRHVVRAGTVSHIHVDGGVGKAEVGLQGRGLRVDGGSRAAAGDVVVVGGGRGGLWQRGGEGALRERGGWWWSWSWPWWSDLLFTTVSAPHNVSLLGNSDKQKTTCRCFLMH